MNIFGKTGSCFVLLLAPNYKTRTWILKKTPKNKKKKLPKYKQTVNIKKFWVTVIKLTKKGGCVCVDYIVDVCLLCFFCTYFGVFFSSARENQHLHELRSLHTHVCAFKLPLAIILIWGVQDLNETDVPFHYIPLMVIFIRLSAQDFIPQWQVFMCVLNLICEPGCQQ